MADFIYLDSASGHHFLNNINDLANGWLTRPARRRNPVHYVKCDRLSGLNSDRLATDAAHSVKSPWLGMKQRPMPPLKS